MKESKPFPHFVSLPMRNAKNFKSGEQDAGEEPLFAALFRAVMVVWSVDFVSECRPRSGPSALRSAEGAAAFEFVQGEPVEAPALAEVDKAQAQGREAGRTQHRPPERNGCEKQPRAPRQCGDTPTEKEDGKGEVPGGFVKKTFVARFHGSDGKVVDGGLDALGAAELDGVEVEV